MKPTVKKILENLSIQKVDLSLIDDAKKLNTDFFDLHEDTAGIFVLKAEEEYGKMLNKYESLKKQINSKLPKIEKAVNELGINRSTFQVLDDLDRRLEDIDETISLIRKNINDLKAVKVY